MLATFGLIGASDTSRALRTEATEVATVNDLSRAAYQHARADLSPAQLAIFEKGREEFARRWVPFPSIGGQWGRGPLSNAESCVQCHPGGGRAGLPGSEGEARGVLLRMRGPDGRTLDPVYGGQLNDQGLLGRVPAEGRLTVSWQQHAFTFADGEVVMLRTPAIHLTEMAYGVPAADTRMSMRIAPQLVGLGLLEQVGETELARLRASQSRRGVPGQINRVWDVARGTVASGRFGWKASQPGLRQQSANAYFEDIGVTTPLYMADNCSTAQAACRATETVVHPEATHEQLDALTAFLQGTAVPARRVADAYGERLFQNLGCEDCHVSTLHIGDSRSRAIHPYTDLMLHDMGAGLADAMQEHAAQGNQWRTAPLWGIGLLNQVSGPSQYLHDGRARNLQEAILWHDGQARPSRNAFAALRREERAILLQFLQSL